MKFTKLLTTVGLSLALSYSVAHAQSTSCLDSARTSAELNKCGEGLIFPLETKLRKEFDRVEEKYKGHQAMQELSRDVHGTWNRYRVVQCLFEGRVVSGGQTIKPLPVEENRVFLKCVLRNLLDMQEKLSNF